ncbi:MAG: hypothetical protein ABIQ16_00180 [Polyangiaceae bacterium]
MKRRYTTFWGSSALLIVLAPGSARAAENSRLQYDAPEGCPTRVEFEAAVTARGGNFNTKLAQDSTFQISITQQANGFHASLTAQTAEQTSNPREVQAPSCTEVVDALAVVTAITLSAGKPTDTKSEPPPAAAQPAPRASPRPPLRGSFDVWSKTLDVEAGKLHLDHAFAIEAFAGPVFGMVSTRAIERLDISASRANFVTLPSGESYLLGTIVRLRAGLLFSQSYRFGDFKTEVGGQEVGASLCVSPHYDTAGWVLLGCAEISAGLVGVLTKDANGATTQNKTQGFGAAGLGIETSYNLGAHFQIGLRLGVAGLTSPITAQRPDGSELFHSSPVIASGMLGIGTHF